MSRLVRSVPLALAAALAVWIGLASLDGFVHALVLVVLWVVLAVAAALVALAARISKRAVRPAVAVVGYAAVLLLVSLPVAAGADAWHAAQARAWCERVAPLWASEPWARRNVLARADTTRPRFAAYVQGGCETANPNQSGTEARRYDPTAGAWAAIDRSDRTAVAQARIWCERVTPVVARMSASERHRRVAADSTRPLRADMSARSCRVSDPAAFLDGAAWHYDAETLTWDEVPE